MDSKADLRYTEDPPAYTPPASSPYLAADAAPRTTPYPAAGRQQYPTPSVYLPPAQQYPPPAGPAPFGQQYGYAQPPAPAASYPPQPGYGTPQYVTAPPPQQVVVVSGAPQQPAVIVQHVPSYCGLIVLSCFVFFFCNPLFGFIAFILAGNNLQTTGTSSLKILIQASPTIFQTANYKAFKTPLMGKALIILTSPVPELITAACS